MMPNRLAALKAAAAQGHAIEWRDGLALVACAEALQPFGSGLAWGVLKAWIVAGAEASYGNRQQGVNAAAQITRWQVAADAALAKLATL